MPDQPTTPKGSTSATGGRSGPYDPKPGAAVKGKGRTGGAAVASAGETQARRAERRLRLLSLLAALAGGLVVVLLPDRGLLSAAFVLITLSHAEILS